MVNSTLSIINAHSSIITPTNTIVIEINTVNAIIPSIFSNTGITRCRTVVSPLLPCLRLMPLLSSLPVLGCYFYCY